MTEKQSSLITEIRERDNEQAKKKEDAITEALDFLTGIFVEKVREAGANTESSRQEAKIFEFKFGDGIQYNGLYLLNLLKDGKLLEKFQEWVDNEHSDEGQRCFLIYYSKMGRGISNDRDKDKYGIFCTWDKERWPILIQSMQRRKEQQNDVRHERRYDRPQGGRGDRNTPENTGGWSTYSGRGDGGRSVRGRGFSFRDRGPRGGMNNNGGRGRKPQNLEERRKHQNPDEQPQHRGRGRQVSNTDKSDETWTGSLPTEHAND